MAKERRFYYACIRECDVGYIGYDQRKERDDPRKGSRQCLHSIRCYPAPDTPNARGFRRPPTYIVTDRPLGRHYMEQTVRKVSRPNFDPITGRKNGRIYRKKVSFPKFELVPNEDVDREIKNTAWDRQWVEDMFKEPPSVIDLPAPEIGPDVAPDEEFIAGTEDIEEVVPKRKAR
jgi:hypothetical protein